MLSTVLNIVMFEDCRNQWSMSRPLLALILLNEDVCSLSLFLNFQSILSKNAVRVVVLHEVARVDCVWATQRQTVGHLAVFRPTHGRHRAHASP